MIRRLAAVAALCSGILLLSSPAAHADVPVTAPTDGSQLANAGINGGVPYLSTMSVALDDGALYSEADLAALLPAPAVPVVAPPPPSSDGANATKIHCSHGTYSFSDKDGTETIRYNCPYNNINWGWQMSQGLQAICSGSVKELGARWFRNGSQQSSNAPHTQGCGYLFHGTFPNVANGDFVDYYDTYTFRVNVGGRTGTAVVQTGGSYQAINP